VPRGTQAFPWESPLKGIGKQASSQFAPWRKIGFQLSTFDLRKLRVARTKKADVVEHPKAFDHVGLLMNKPPGKVELLLT
jgi:hypothetical protein